MADVSAETRILPDTAVAAARHGSVVNTYHQYPNKSIIERRWRESEGTHDDKDTGIVARIFTPLAASFESDDEEWHIYYFDLGGVLQEKYRSGKDWVTSKLGELKIIPYYSSRLAVAFLDKLPHIFYQVGNQWIAEAFRTGKDPSSPWKLEKQNLGAFYPLWRTSLTAVTVDGKILVYYQKDTPNLQQLIAKTDKSSFIPITPETSWHTPLAAVTESGAVILFYTNFDNTIQEVIIHDVAASRAVRHGDTNPKGQIAAVAWKVGNDVEIRVYWQDKTTNEIMCHKIRMPLAEVVNRAKNDGRNLVEEPTMKKQD